MDLHQPEEDPAEADGRQGDGRNPEENPSPEGPEAGLPKEVVADRADRQMDQINAVASPPARFQRGEEPGAESSWVKLQWSHMTQHLSQTAVDLLGEEGQLSGKWSRQFLWSGAAGIAGGTSEVQRTIIGERILGLPRG